jgi:membrane associated rhomboid family serine protease
MHMGCACIVHALHIAQTAVNAAKDAAAPTGYPMIPIRDHNPSKKTPFVTGALIAANVAAFFMYSQYMADERTFLLFLDDWALIPARLIDGEGHSALLTSMFIHAGLLHLGGNMLFLWIFGDNMEEAFGHVGFLLFYLVAGVAAAFAQIAMNPASTVPMVGASGAVAGVLGGYLLLFPKARVDILVIFIVFVGLVALPAWIVLGAWFGIQLLGSLAQYGADGGGVAFAAHAGGFVAGLALTIPVWLARGGPGWWRTCDGHPPHPPTKVTERMSTIPRVGRRR